jgi:hypothetical protein
VGENNPQNDRFNTVVIYWGTANDKPRNFQPVSERSNPASKERMLAKGIGSGVILPNTRSRLTIESVFEWQRFRIVSF